MYDEIRRYHPYDEQEATDKRTILQFLDRNPDALLRDNGAAHLTASAIVVDPTMTKVLFAFHNIYRSWSWVGGHNDGDPDFLSVAVREAKEETGIVNVRPHSDDIFMLDVIYVHNHVKKGKYVGDHLHLNVTYLLVADESDALVVKPDENAGVRWFPIDSVLEHVSEERMKAVYAKAFAKIGRIRTTDRG
ncbi:MAG: NUDIX hydrolase [Candidatus Izemoplasmatales bacterium]